MSPHITPPAPDLAQLHEQLQLAAQAYPDLRQGLGAALASVERRLGIEPAPNRRDRRRQAGGLR